MAVSDWGQDRGHETDELFLRRDGKDGGYDYDLYKYSIGVPGRHQGVGTQRGLYVFMPVVPRLLVTRIDKNVTLVICEKSILL